ncbi:MAG: RNA polymerase sigma factor [Proteobacteria bacterium]|nr:RNA polymerase sigma factor [Pseudomonadota bacterium]
MPLSKTQIQKIFASHHHMVSKAVSILRPEIKGLTAEDVEQEACIRLLKLIKSDREIEISSSYIYRMTANIIIDLVRKNKRHTHETPISDELEDDYNINFVSESKLPEQQLANEHSIENILNVIETLSENRRVAVKLRLQGFKNKEISDMTGWSYNKVESLSKRGLKDLRSKLIDLGIEYETD